MIEETASVQRDVTETGSSMAEACGEGARRPQRKLSVGDLHIRTRHEDSASAFREIRAILREIRDSLQPDPTTTNTTTTGGAQSSAVDSPESVAAAAAGAASSNCVEDVQDSSSARPTDMRCRRRRDGAGGWRHCRLSLPARLRPGGHVDGLLNGEVDGAPGLGRTGSRRRHHAVANVRFADELGMNLNTFAMIPSRQVRDDSPLTRLHLPPFHDGAPAARTRLGSPPPPPPRPEDPSASGDDELPAPPAESDHDSEDDDDGLRSPTEAARGHEQFRLCFRQPFAELDEFRRRLDRQRVCLENVRVDDWAAHHAAGAGAASNSSSASSPTSPRSPMAANSVILCSIQIQSSGGGGGPSSRVFARCTSDNWRTFADLPAQRVTGLDSLGLGYERYCFAVRRPAAADPPPPPRSASGSPATLDHAAVAAADGTTPSAVVEFAVCSEAVDAAAAAAACWDNNDGANYRIEWFRNVT